MDESLIEKQNGNFGNTLLGAVAAQMFHLKTKVYE